MVSDQKGHNSRHEKGGSDNIKTIGGPNTYVEVDTTNDEIKLVVNNTVVQKWS